MTRWARKHGKKVVHTKLTQGSTAAQPEDDPETAAAKAWAMANPPVNWGKPKTQTQDDKAEDKDGQKKASDDKSDKKGDDGKKGVCVRACVCLSVFYMHIYMQYLHKSNKKRDDGKKGICV